MDRRTRAALDEVVGPEAPTFEQLAAHDAEWASLIHSAWVAGRIPGFPDETEWEAALEWLSTAYRARETAVYAEARSRSFGISGDGARGPRSPVAAR